MSVEIKFIGTKEVAEALGCSLPTARNIMLRADFPLIRVGKNLKVELNAFLTGRRKEGYEYLKHLHNI